jgi:lipopolysaccharide/colanic/teichoic acid biosynthesis glycosyltransferase
MAIIGHSKKTNRRSVHEFFQKQTAKTLERELYAEEYFHRSLHVEMRRAERSRKPFILMLLDLGYFVRETAEKKNVIKETVKCLVSMTRETDIKGWYRHKSIIGTLFTEIGHVSDMHSMQNQLSEKLDANLRGVLSLEQRSRIPITWHVFPAKCFADDAGGNFSPFVGKPKESKELLLKRMIDIFGSLFALTLFFPVFIFVGALVRLSSEGPVFFRQERIGLGGRKFSFLKFRSMYVNNDQTVHKEYIKKFMEGRNEQAESDKKGIFKITQDPRITPIGRFLRKTSLDELPQFVNVLKGEMSLVGPRPPLRYECEGYDLWHLRRIQEMKPGITGLWQVNGRSTTAFDDMVRMDIDYVRSWSLWQDLAILVKTPFVILRGAY